MTDKWVNDAKMNQFLRPQTLFGTKFESYLNTETVDEFVNPYEGSEYHPPVGGKKK